VAPHRLLELPQIPDDRGKLTFVEEGLHIPFEIRRVFYIYEVPQGQSRAGHARTGVDEVVVALSGSFEVVTEFAGERDVVSLDSPVVGLYLPGIVWRELRAFSPGAVCLVLASERYNPAVYLADGDVLEANPAQPSAE
jgi:WxcM-like, C-terminal